MAGIEKRCAVCGADFSVPKNREHSAKTCSLKCCGILTAQRYKEARVKKVCVICGKEFSVPKCHDKRRKCCSGKCARKLDSQRAHQSGKDCYNWIGGLVRHSDGYLYSLCKLHPFAKSGRYVLEHRLVVESRMRQEVPDHKFLVEVDGVKYLRPGIEVHHINEIKRDNKPSNLLACTSTAHRAIHSGRPPMQGEVWPNVVGMVPYKPTYATVKCETCGEDFKKLRSTVDRGNVRFCTRSCYDNRKRTTFKAMQK